MTKVFFGYHCVEAAVKEYICVVRNEFLNYERAHLLVCLFLQHELPETGLTLTQLNYLVDVVGGLEASSPLCATLVELCSDLLNQLPFKEVSVHGQVLVSDPDQLALWCLRNTRLLDTEVKKDLNAGAKLILLRSTALVLKNLLDIAVRAFHDQRNDALN